jgi:formyltetrahydrofolate synthetase
VRGPRTRSPSRRRHPSFGTVLRVASGASSSFTRDGDELWKRIGMPGLPKKPASDNIDIDADGNIVGLA